MATEAAPNQQQSLSGKVALVSGSSSGIGAAIARELSLRGANIIINYPFASEEAAARSVLEGLKTKSSSIIAEADLSTIDGGKKLASFVADKFGKINFLINNAGHNNMCNLTESSDAEVLEGWEKTVNLNGRGTLLLTRAVLPILATAGSRIVNIGSSTCRDPDPHMSIYAGTKGMIESFTRCWARDLPRKYGCTVNAVLPGPVGTEGLLAAAAASDEFSKLLQGRQEKTPAAARFAKPEEIAWTVATLCEEGASWVNGAIIPVTGGGALV